VLERASLRLWPLQHTPTPPIIEMIRENLTIARQRAREEIGHLRKRAGLESNEL
jgi:hypothetical protein